MIVQRLPAAAPVGLGGFFDEIGDVLEKVRDVVKDVVTLKYIRKGFRWAWANMPDEMRVLVMKVGPIVAGVYGGPFGKQAAELALGLLEQDRYSREQRKQFKRDLAKTIAHYEAEGLLEEGVVDIDNSEHLEAIVLAGQMPPELVDDWFRQRGLAPPARPFAGKGALIGIGAGALLLAAGVALQKRRVA